MTRKRQGSIFSNFAHSSAHSSDVNAVSLAFRRAEQHILETFLLIFQDLQALLSVQTDHLVYLAD